MRKSTQATLLTLSSALVGLSAWQWGLGGLGVSLTLVATAVMTMLARRPAIVSPDLPGTTSPLETQLMQSGMGDLGASAPSSGSHTAAADMALSLRLAEAAQRASHLTDGLQAVGELLKEHLQARAWVALRVDDWSGDNGLLRPWMDLGNDKSDVIDVTTMTTVTHQSPALGEALSTLRPAGALSPADARWQIGRAHV